MSKFGMFAKKNKFALAGAAGGAVTEVLDNYWVFTSTPMLSNSENPADIGAKAIYLLLQILITAALYAAVGYVLDRSVATPTRGRWPEEEVDSPNNGF